MADLLIRADASPAIGSGHLMRCLALAQAWREKGGAVHLAAADITPSLEQRYRAEGAETTRVAGPAGSAADRTQTIALARRLVPGWVVLDGYRFDTDYQRALREAGLRVLLVDDNAHAGHYATNVVLNQNLHAEEALYARRDADTRLLLGPRYAMLRREFRAWRTWPRDVPARARRVLITLGGGDPDNVSLKVVQALPLMGNTDWEATLVVGGANPNAERLKRATGETPIDLRFDVQNMPELMAHADAAVANGGSTSWELAFMGLPSLTLILAENQREVAEGLTQAEISRTLGRHDRVAPAEIAQALEQLLSDEQSRTSMSQRGRRLIDGQGAFRVVEALSATGIHLRPAEWEDARLLWEWANEPEARAAFFSVDPIPWESHLQWLKAKLASGDSRIFIGLNAGEKPVGQVRFDISVDRREAVISVSVDRYTRRKGIGTELIDKACTEFFSCLQVDVINAYIKPENTASLAAFRKAGFHIVGHSLIKSHSATHLIRQGRAENGGKGA